MRSSKLQWKITNNLLQNILVLLPVIKNALNFSNMSSLDFKNKLILSLNKETKNQNVMPGFRLKVNLKILITELLMLTQMHINTIKIKLLVNRKIRIIKIQYGVIKKKKLKKDKHCWWLTMMQKNVFFIQKYQD